MKLVQLKCPIKGGGRGAFTLVESVVAVGLAGIVFISVFSGFSSGYAVVQITRENVRAAQILTEKMEIVRLCSWTQITNGSFLPTSFTAPFDDSSSTNHGLMYQGTTIVAAVPLSETYSNDLRLVTVQLTWTSGSVQRTRAMSTYVSQYGIQNFIY